ncbi:MAG: hypothetical protein NZL95_07390 [Chitinophagales bacterium]|nr:hypothetical protein [Chitinophagales bacterium]MDW8428360.1 hypothetical protein [Chitinophagales bacterium]
MRLLISTFSDAADRLFLIRTNKKDAEATGLMAQNLISRDSLLLVMQLCSLLCFSCVRKSQQAASSEHQMISAESNAATLAGNVLTHNEIADWLAPFAAENYSVLDSVRGDLNNDGLSDLLVVLRRNGEDTLSNVIEHPEKRPLLLLLRQQDGRLHLAARNDHVVYCYDCGGVLGDPYGSIAISGDSFTVEQYGGSAWRWSRTLTFRYFEQEENWFLWRDLTGFYHTSDPQDIDLTLRTEQDFGKIKFAEFDIYQDQE